MKEVNFKETEIGKIPVDWEVKVVNEIGTINGRVGWKGYTKEDLVDDGPFAIGAKHINKNNKLDLSDPTKLSLIKYLESPEIFVFKDDILITQRGTIGKVVLIDKEIGEATINPSMLIFRVKKYSEKFVFYFLTSDIGLNQILNLVSSTGVPMITQRQVLEMQIPLPPLAEQGKIAEVLSDTDLWIESTEALLAKKRLLKKGAMQKLFSPKEDWEVAELKDIAWFQEGPGLRNWQFTDSGMKVINVTNLENGYLNLSRTKRYISLQEFDKMYKHFEIQENDIVVASSGNSYGKIAVVREKDLPLVMNTSVIRFKPLERIDYDFLLVFLKSVSFKEQIDLLITGGAQPNFGPAHLNKILVNLPPKNEQKNIADVILSMDLEIESLENHLQKARSIKQGMMQDLLTGKVRLV